MSAMPATPATPARRRPLTAPQSGIWFGHEADPTRRRFTAGQYVQFHGAIDEELFERALRGVVAGSESLRARFEPTADGAVQIIEDAADWPLHRQDLRHHEDPAAAARAFLAAELAHPYDLTARPPFDHFLLRTGEAEYLWYLRIHHILCDGVGGAGLMRRVAAEYTALHAGEPPSTGVHDPLQALLDDDAAYRSSARFRTDAAFWAEESAASATRPASRADAAPRPARARARRSPSGRSCPPNAGPLSASAPARAGRRCSRPRSPSRCTPTPARARR